MKVGLIASPWVPVPPPRYGGTEVVLDVLARGLVAAGDDVELFTTGDSTCPVPRHSVYAAAIGTAAITPAAEARHVVHAYDALAGCDVIHDHTLFGPLYGPGRTSAPIVTTSHGPFTPELRDLYATMAHREVSVVAISRHQRATAPGVPIAAVIHHGIDVDRVPFGNGDGGYALFLGRMCPDKGPDRAIRAARAAGVRVILAAKMWEPDEMRYFRDVVEPMLGDDAVYIGEIGGREKLDLLGHAIALLNPIRWPEPFGLVMVEALAAGTPVVSFADGSAPEIVDHGTNGYLCADVDAMADALRHVHELDRTACRRSAAERFSTERMVADHRRLYRRLVDGGRSADVIDLSARATPRPDAVSASAEHR